MIACPHCGGIIEHGRSGPDHRRFFAMVKAAYLNWPEHEYQPSSEEALRAYLLIKAGHTNVAKAEVPPGYAESETVRTQYRAVVEGVCRAVVSEGRYFELRTGPDAAEIVTARSIDYATVGRREFGRIREAVELFLEDALGVTADQLLRERAA